MPIPSLPTSKPSTTFLSTSTFGSILYGTAGNDQLTANSTRVALDGGAGDDVYYLFKSSANYAQSNTHVVEYASAGIDTIYTPSSYVLPWMVENLYLTSTGNARFAIGNDGNNILKSAAGNDYLITGGGNDVMFGGAGVDTFGFTKQANTTSWVADFEAGIDRLNLTNLGFKSFAAVLSASTQVGPDLKIATPSGQTIMLANATSAKLDAAHVIVDTPSIATGAFKRLTFSDEFNGPLSLNTGTAATAGGTWKTSFHQGDRRLYGNHDEQIYVDPDFTGKNGAYLGLNPFVIQNGVLHIQARPTDPALLASLWNVPYTSGMLSTQLSFQQQYGYFEIRAQDPAGKGMFPAFWMLPADKSWPPEIDIYEQVGHLLDHVNQGVASAAKPTESFETVTGTDMTKGFHTYGMEWTAQKITWFIDGVKSFQVDTPGDAHKPMYLLVTLAVGGDWPGRPDSTVDWSKADLLVDYVRAYSLDASAASPVGLQVTISNATNPTDLSDSFVLPLGVAGASTTFTGTQMQIAGVPSSAAVTAAYAANGDLTLTSNAAWNVIKNATIKATDAAAHGVTVRNFVDVELTGGGGQDKVSIAGMKRGTVSTGDGNDSIDIAGQSNSSTSNLSKVAAGLGDDTINFGGSAYSKATLDGGAGNDTIKLTGQATGTLLGGAGADKLTDLSPGAVTLSGGTGADVFGFRQGAQATVTDFVAGSDSVQLIGMTSAQVHLSYPGTDTLIDLGGNGSVRLTGVHLTAAQIDFHFT